MFKYSFAAIGRYDNIYKFATLLFDSNRLRKHTNDINTKDYSIFISKKGPYTFMSEASHADFTLNINEEWYQKAALAIASIYDDELPHIGEWVISQDGVLGELGKLFKICEVSTNHKTYNVEGVNPSGSWSTSLDYNRKATPEEIINYFKPKVMPADVDYRKDNRKIVGYKSSIDLFNGKAPKGTLFVKTSWSKDFYGWGDNAKTTSYSNHLPKEIVEQWEPVYEPTEVKLTIGTPAREITIRDGKAICKHYAFTKSCIQLLLENFVPFQVGGLKSHVKTIQIGCEEGTAVTKEEVQSILDILNNQ